MNAVYLFVFQTFFALLIVATWSTRNVKMVNLAAPPLRPLGGLDTNQNAQGSLPWCGSEVPQSPPAALAPPSNPRLSPAHYNDWQLLCIKSNLNHHINGIHHSPPPNSRPPKNVSNFWPVSGEPKLEVLTSSDPGWLFIPPFPSWNSSFPSIFSSADSCSWLGEIWYYLREILCPLGLITLSLAKWYIFLICIRKLTRKESFLLTSQLDHLQFLLGNVWKEQFYGRQQKGEPLFRPDSYSLDMQLRKLTLSININCCPSILIAS